MNIHRIDEKFAPTYPSSQEFEGKEDDKQITTLPAKSPSKLHQVINKRTSG